MADRDRHGVDRRADRDRQGAQRDGSIGRALCSGSGWCGHGSCSGRLACSELNGELIANNHDELHDAEQEDEEQRKAQGQLDGSLTTIAVGSCVAKFTAWR